MMEYNNERDTSSRAQVLGENATEEMVVNYFLSRLNYKARPRPPFMLNDGTKVITIDCSDMVDFEV